MQRNCNPTQIHEIVEGGISAKPWDNPSLKEPCTDGDIAYYAAYIADAL
jgi:hypothetical protein